MVYDYVIFAALHHDPAQEYVMPHMEDPEKHISQGSVAFTMDVNSGCSKRFHGEV